VVNKGKIQQIDTPQQLYDHPINRFVAGFIGSPPMNFIEGKIEKTQAGLVFSDKSKMLIAQINDQPALAAYAGQDMVMGIRPEHLHTSPVKGEQYYAAFSSEVQLVERLGHESFAFASLGGEQVVARLMPEEGVELNKNFTFYAEVAKMHFFEPENGEVV